VQYVKSRKSGGNSTREEHSDCIKENVGKQLQNGLFFDTVLKIKCNLCIYKNNCENLIVSLLLLGKGNRNQEVVGARHISQLKKTKKQ
jgi:hypothetical protein